MGNKRKSRRRSENPETLIPKLEEDDENLPAKQQEEGEKGGNGFFACYLLTSLSPRHKGHTYIGFTVNPRRRIRQHNGEIGCGAWRTKTKRPWEMVLCIYGFPTNVAALQFEWAWQHPVESLAVRKAAVEFKSLNGLANKIKLAYTMLTLPSWRSLNLMVNFFSSKYTKHYAGCPSLPIQMKVQVHSMDELPCYTGDVDMYEKDVWDEDEECDGTSRPSDFVEEGPEDAATVDDSSDSQNSVKEAPPEWSRCIDENSPRQPRSSPIQSEERRLSYSSEKGLSLFHNSMYSGMADVADRGMFSSVEECTIELDSPTTQNFPPAPADKDQPPVKHSVEPCPVEVIDVFSPSPEYSSLHRKKRAGSSVCPSIIDLTQSPIFV